MASQITTYDEVIRNVDALSAEEKLRLIAYLAETARQTYEMKPSVRYWREIRGVTTYPLVVEDAQIWITENRQASDQNREK